MKDYSLKILEGLSNLEKELIEDIAQSISENPLLYGRPRFSSFFLEQVLASKDMCEALSSFYKA